MKKEKILRERIFEKLEGLFDKVIYERKHGYESNPKPELDDIEHIIRHYSSKCARISIGATLLPGEWGIISAVPEIMLGMKKQAEMVYDISAAHKKDNLMTREVLAGVLLQSLTGESYGLVKKTNSNFIINENKKIFDYALAKFARRISRMIFRSALVRWLPGFSTVSQTLISGRVTRNIGSDASDIFGGNIEIIKSTDEALPDNEYEWMMNNCTSGDKLENNFKQA
jgi:hypothetical protein